MSSEMDFTKLFSFSRQVIPIDSLIFLYLISFYTTDTHVTWGVNFGKDNLTAAFLEAKAIVKAFASTAVKAAGITLDFIEIGNEADLYNGNGDRPSSYSVAQYVPEFVFFFH